ncbi:phosphate uptake regulator PhoU [Candidatus Woesearchaeota archaeon]|nr:phosphate uptake regulator PhoU [Candidatus Woesearchaeota archaeon]
MEYRKLISFGKSSYVVSLPKNWINQNKLKKGNTVYLEEREQDLILSARDNKKAKVDSEIIIQVNGKSVRRLQREIISAYIKDYKTITLVGEELKDKAVEVQNTIQNLMALEVMEQTSKKIVAKDFLDMDNISIFNMIRKIDIILRAMIEDCERMFIHDNYENIYHRDNDVNRLSFLVFRIVEFGLSNSSFMYKKHNLNPQNLLYLWWFAFNLESIGDDIKRIARFMREMKNVNKKQQEHFLKLFTEAKNGYLVVLKGFHNHDEELAHAVLENKEKIIKEVDEFYNENKKIENLGLLIEKLKSMITNSHNLGRVVYQYGFTK